MLLHLGMSGRLLFDGEPRGVHEHLTLTFDDATVLRFVDPRRFGMLDLCATAELPPAAGSGTWAWSRWRRPSMGRHCSRPWRGGGRR